MKKRQNTRKQKLTLFQKIIISVIFILFALIIIYIIVAFTFTPENIAKSKIEQLSSNYYENYLYEQIIESGNSNPAEILEEYKDTGLSIVYLRQLLLHKDQDDSEITVFLTEHCDENKTSVKYYPKPPYNKNSYYTEYSYSCDF